MSSLVSSLTSHNFDFYIETRCLCLWMLMRSVLDKISPRLNYFYELLFEQRRCSGKRVLKGTQSSMMKF